jgi:hypothetical protein
MTRKRTRLGVGLSRDPVVSIRFPPIVPPNPFTPDAPVVDRRSRGHLSLTLRRSVAITRDRPVLSEGFDVPPLRITSEAIP